MDLYWCHLGNFWCLLNPQEVGERKPIFIGLQMETVLETVAVDLFLLDFSDYFMSGFNKIIFPPPIPQHQKTDACVLVDCEIVTGDL